MLCTYKKYNLLSNSFLRDIWLCSLCVIIFFLSENTAGEAPTVRFFLLNKKEEKGTSLYNYTTDTKTERATGLRMTEEEETKLGSLYKERASRLASLNLKACSLASSMNSLFQELKEGHPLSKM